MFKGMSSQCYLLNFLGKKERKRERKEGRKGERKKGRKKEGKNLESISVKLCAAV